MQCKICGKQSKRLGQHVSMMHKISAKDYYDKYLKQLNDGICPMCGKETLNDTAILREITDITEFI